MQYHDHIRAWDTAGYCVKVTTLNQFMEVCENYRTGLQQQVSFDLDYLLSYDN